MEVLGVALNESMNSSAVVDGVMNGAASGLAGVGARDWMTIAHLLPSLLKAIIPKTPAEPASPMPEPEPLKPELSDLEPEAPEPEAPKPEAELLPEPDAKCTTVVVRPSQPYQSTRHVIERFPTQNKKRKMTAQECIARNLPPSDVNVPQLRPLSLAMCEAEIAKSGNENQVTLTKQAIAKKRKEWACAQSDIAACYRRIAQLEEEVECQPSLEKLFIWAETMRSMVKK